MISGYKYYVQNFIQTLTTKKFKGWGRKKTGLFAVWCHKVFGGNVALFEDGFIRSLGLGVHNSTPFSIVDTRGQH